MGCQLLAVGTSFLPSVPAASAFLALAYPAGPGSHPLAAQPSLVSTPAAVAVEVVASESVAAVVVAARPSSVAQPVALAGQVVQVSAVVLGNLP